MTRLLREFLPPLVLVGAALYLAATTRRPLPARDPTTAAEFVGTVRQECDATCSPLRARWTVAELGDSTMMEPKFLGRCECAEPPNIGVGPRVKRRPGG